MWKIDFHCFFVHPHSFPPGAAATASNTANIYISLEYIHK